MTVISDVSIPKKVKCQPKQFIKTTNGVILEHQLVADAREQKGYFLLYKRNKGDV